MARVFAQEPFNECVKQGIDSRYEMIILAAHRARHLNKLSKTNLVLPAEEYNKVSKGVTVLREIETGKIDMIELREDYINSITTATEILSEESESSNL